ncbi:hypothetical protein [Deinococcus pimensis]|uniref:hypothetical protein n=1 Tax=Deinococcus pimensis TaxID=309888 RepID=UPI000487E180|nr:hypothetical protein [Deinococcus pimensis]
MANDTERTTTAKLQSFEEHARDANTPAWLVAAAAQVEQWLPGQHMTRATYDKAVEATRNIEVRS